MVQAGRDLGPYRLVRRIGSGGMAEVFLAHRMGAGGFKRPVAIKTILAHGAEEEAINLFLDEARVALLLEHAAIVRTIEIGLEDETLFIVMEYVQGPALSRILRELKRLGRFLPGEVVAYTGARVAAGLDFSHRRATAPDGSPLRLVHRDVSPQNILLTREGLIKLSDFGVARASVQTHKTRTGQVRGKAAYMAPEQVRAKALDGRTDVFALGLVLYEALTNTRAYQRKTDIQSMRAILTDPVQPIRELNPDAPPDLVEVIMRALEKDPERRWASAGELEAALERTCRSTATPLIEAQIRALIEELFGESELGDELPVEAWQPTMAHDAEGGGPRPQRLPGAKLSPKIAELIEQSRPTPATPVRTPEVLTPTSGPAIPIFEATGVNEPLSLPGTAIPSASFHTPSPLPEPLALTPTSQLQMPRAPPPSANWLARAGVGTVLLLGVVVVGVGVSALTPREVRSTAPSQPAAVLVERAEPRVVAEPARATERAAEATAVRAAVEPRGRAAAEPRDEPRRRPAPAEEPRNGEVSRSAGEPPRPEAKLGAEPPRRTRTEPTEAAPERPSADPAEFQKRVLSTFKALEQRGQAELATSLKRLLLDLQTAKRGPTAEERALLERAERTLRE